MTPDYVIADVAVAPGQAKALTILNPVDTDEFAILYAPDPNRVSFSEYYENGALLALTKTTSPLLLTLPGVYRLVPNGDLSDTVDVDASAVGFPIVLTKAVG